MGILLRLCLWRKYVCGLGGWTSRARGHWPILLGHSCRLMTWRQDRKRSCQAKGNNNPGTSFSVIAKKSKSIYGHSVNCSFKFKHFENFVWDTSSRLWHNDEGNSERIMMRSCCSCWNLAELRCSYWNPVECRDVATGIQYIHPIIRRSFKSMKERPTQKCE